MATRKIPTQDKKAADQVAFDVKAYPYLRCREQHVWEPYDGTIDKKNKVGHRVQQCPNCGMKRHTVLSLHPLDRGHVISRSYRPPVDYRVPGGVSSADRGLIVAHNFLSELAAEYKK